MTLSEQSRIDAQMEHNQQLIRYCKLGAIITGTFTIIFLAIGYNSKILIELLSN